MKFSFKDIGSLVVLGSGDTAKIISVIIENGICVMAIGKNLTTNKFLIWNYDEECEECPVNSPPKNL